MSCPIFRFIALSLFMVSLFSVSAFARNRTQFQKLQTDFEQAILKEINEARANPLKYINYLESHKKKFTGNRITLPDGQIITTSEGIAAIDDAISFLKFLPKLEPYSLSKGLSIAAASQIADLMENSSLGHFGKDGKNLPQRLGKFGSYGNLTAENITYFAPTPRDILITMIIDDGVKSRGHRKNIFSRNFRQIGSAFGKGAKGENLCVLIFTDTFKETGNIPTDKRLIKLR